MTIAENIANIKSEIGKAELIAVTKTHSVENVREAINAGHRVFGENRVQEAESKFPELKQEFPDIELHLIGPLQSNKAKEALKLFDVIQTLDREKLAREIHKHTNYRTREFFIQVNIGEEEQKAGIAPKQTKEFFEFCTKELKLPVTGLMCIPPVNEPAFTYFALLKNIALSISPNLKLSMGMSGDYLEAAELGATHIRVGSAIFGQRN